MTCSACLYLNVGYVLCSYFVFLHIYYPLVDSLCGSHFMFAQSKGSFYVSICIMTHWRRDVFYFVLNALLIDDMEVGVVYEFFKLTFLHASDEFSQKVNQVTVYSCRDGETSKFEKR